MNNKIKTVRSGGSTYLVFHSEKNQSLSERELFLINSGSVIGLLPVNVEQKGKSFKLVYNVTGLVNMRDYIRNPINKSCFAVLLQNIVDSLDSMEKAYLKHQFAIFDIDFVMINPASQKVYFPFVPIQFYENDTNLKLFLCSIADSCNFMKNEDTSYVFEYIKILNSGINFSFFELKEYVKNLSEASSEKNRTRLVKCPNCKASFAFGMNYCPVCGMKVGSETAVPENAIYNPVTIDEQKTHLNHEPENRISQRGTNNYFDETQDAYQVDNSTKIHAAAECEQNNRNSFYGAQNALNKIMPEAILVLKTGERISVAKRIFTLGKDPTSDCCVRLNSAVSKRHAQIVLENGAFYFEDLGSTNKSFINGVMVQPNVKIQLQSGMTISLANERIIFYCS